jgi:hypothetical protein
MFDVKVMPWGPLRSGEANPNLGLPQALVGVHGYFTGHNSLVGIGGGWCGLERLGLVPEGWSSPMRQ